MPSFTTVVIAALVVLASGNSVAARDILIEGSLVVNGNVRAQLGEHVQHERKLLEIHNSERKAQAAAAASGVNGAAATSHFYALGLAAPDVGRVALDGNVRAAYTNAAGSFSLPVPVPASGVAVHQLQADWGVLMYPIVTVEVDASGNYRCSLDSGEVVASKGKIGSTAGAKKQQQLQAARARSASAAAGKDGEEEEAVADFETEADHDEVAPSSGASQTRLVLQAAAVANFYVPRQHFSIFDILKNPMVMMIGFTAFVALVMPKLVDQDELRNQMREMQQSAEGGASAAAPAAVTGGASSQGQQQRRR
jgi:hypothetical protein